RIERWLLQKMSGTMQIESLRHFNGKYDPDWRPRYAVYDSPGDMLPSAWAVAKAESFVELPLIGRMLAPKADTAA
ncbi:MAG TPA: phosphatidylglycerol lysyltransferase domain-containing protein, partial [Acidimicrobiia bacterium]|nr:phosphatidylglycerol lysyltransferase domain-containing protein [Acidimicrobiia bacterium]